MDEAHFHSALALALLGCMVLSGAALACGVVAPYGRYSATKSLAMSWGPPAPSRVAWCVQELRSLVIPAACAAAGRPTGGNAVLLAFFAAHYFNRAVVYPLRIRGGKPTPLGVAAAAFAFTAANGYLQGRGLAARWAPRVPVDGRFAGGLAAACLGALGNIWHDGVLRDLRRTGAPGEYKIPRGGLFDHVSGANFLCEIVEWAGFAVAARTPAAAVFAACCALNVGPRAVHHHRWYRRHFGDAYPPDRRALVPFLL